MNEETDLTNLDAPPVNGLDSIFVLPASLAEDARIRAWYEEMVTQLRREAAGIPMKSAQYTLMERIAYYYALMRYQELSEVEVSERERAAVREAWQKMIDQFNRLLEKHNDKLLNEMLVKVQNILFEHLPIVTDERDRKSLRRAYVEAFASIEL